MVRMNIKIVEGLALLADNESLTVIILCRTPAQDLSRSRETVQEME